MPRNPNIPWLFWNRQYRRPPSCVRHLWQTILEHADLGRLFGHANHQSTARYAHLDDEHLFDAAQQVGDPVQSLLA
ncbi:MAG: hypothetical protein H2049_06900 [Porphyrobacter sp.]|nr:hypothetical protein [Porphyrobacter sp.]